MSINTIISGASQYISDLAPVKKVNELIDEVYSLAVLKPAGSADIGGDGWVFDIPQNERIKHSRDTTDHWTENGLYLNDHSVKKPLEITLSGMVGALVDFYRKKTTFGKIEGLAGALGNRLTALGGTLGLLGDDLTQQAQQKMQKLLRDVEMAASTAKQLQQRGENIVNAISGVTKESRIKEQYDKIYALYAEDALFTVSTAFGQFDNMSITELSISSLDETEHAANITVSLKQLRIAEIEIVSFKDNQFAPANQMQSAKAVNIGMITGKKTALKQMLDNGKSLF
jgi:hypothetical protein